MDVFVVFFFLPLHIDLSTVVVFVVVEISLLGMEMIMVAQEEWGDGEFSLIVDMSRSELSRCIACCCHLKSVGVYWYCKFCLV